MDVLTLEPLDPQVLHWLGARHRLRHAPELAMAERPLLLRQVARVRALVLPPGVAVDAALLHAAPLLRAVGRVSSGAENIDTAACARAGIEVVRPVDAVATAEAEFCVGALLQMLRRVPVLTEDGLPVGRELGGSTVGLVGLSPTARTLSALLAGFGARVVGYDPALHGSDPLYARWAIEPLPLQALLESCDGVCVLLGAFTRYRGLLGERLLAGCKPEQVLVNLAHSDLFDEVALADALAGGRLAAAWFDSLEPGWLDPGRPLRHLDTLQVTPRLAATTRESRLRSAWAVARRIDALLAGAVPRPGELSTLSPAALAELADGPAPA